MKLTVPSILPRSAITLAAALWAACAAAGAAPGTTGDGSVPAKRGPAAIHASSIGNPTTQPVVLALKTRAVYIDPAMKSLVTQAKLEQIAASFKPTSVKIGVIKAFPATPRDRAAEFIHSFANLGTSILILVSDGTGPLGTGHVSVVAPQIEPAVRDQIVADAEPRFAASYDDGITAAATETVEALHGNLPGSHRRFIWMILILIAAFVLVAVVTKRSIRRPVRS